jgi:PAS domain-containing protein
MPEQDWRLAVVVCLLGVVIIALYAMRRFAWRFGMRGDGLLAITLDNMTQGVVMFDAAERLIVCNNRFIDLRQRIENFLQSVAV